MPSYLEVAYPFTQPEDRGLVLDSVQQAYVAAWSTSSATAWSTRSRTRSWWSPPGDFGSVPEGSQLTFRAGGNQHSRAFLPVRPVEAEVVAVDQRDRPVLLERRVGAGRLLLCTYPLEHMVAVTPRVNPEPTYRIYDALAEIAGVRRPVTVEDPRVLAAELRHRRGHRFVWLVSQAATGLTVKPTVSGALAELDTGRPVEEVALRPYGVQVLRLLPTG